MSYSNHTSLRDNEIHEEIHHSYTLRIQIFFQIEHAVLSLKAVETRHQQLKEETITTTYLLGFLSTHSIGLNPMLLPCPAVPVFAKATILLRNIPHSNYLLH